MVKFWDVQIDKGIKLTKARIAHFEKHGNGSAAIREKRILQKQERHKQVRKEKNVST